MAIDSYTGAGQTETGVDPYLYSRSIRGVPSNKNRTHRARRSSWDTHYGITSDGREISRKIGYQTFGGPVTVIKDGIATEHDASEFRRARKSSRRSSVIQNQQQQRRMDLLASCGNASELASGDC